VIGGYYLLAGNKYRVLFEWDYAQSLSFNTRPDSIRLRIAYDPSQTGVQINETKLEGTFQFEREEPDSVYVETSNCAGSRISNSLPVHSKKKTRFNFKVKKNIGASYYNEELDSYIS